MSDFLYSLSQSIYISGYLCAKLNKFWGTWWIIVIFSQWNHLQVQEWAISNVAQSHS